MLERDAGLARIELVLGHADRELILDREHELHQRQRVEAQALEGRVGPQDRAIDLELVAQDADDFSEEFSVHGQREDEVSPIGASRKAAALSYARRSYPTPHLTAP